MQETKPAARKRPEWAFFTSHALVLQAVERQPTATMREIANRVGITQRHVQRIVDDLEADGYISRERDGRQNRYAVHWRRAIDHLDAAPRVADLLNLLEPKAAH